MVFVATLRTFEIVLIVFITCWNSRLMANENEVLNLTILEIVSYKTYANHWIRVEDLYLWEYASGIKKVEHPPSRENALCFSPFLKGHAY